MVTKESVLQRLEKLEQRVRGLKRLGLLVLAIALAVVGLGATPKTTLHGIKAESFTVVDEDGRHRAVLGLGVFGEPCLLLFSDKGKA